MNRTLVGVCTAVVMSAAVLGAQAKSSNSAVKASDDAKGGAAASTGAVTLTGCLAPGSKSDAFYLTSAKQKGVKDAPTTVKLVPATKKVDIGAFVTHEVEVTGTLDRSDTSATPAGSGAAPTLTVTKVKSRNDQC
jgi:hypothetical protein